MPASDKTVWIAALAAARAGDLGPARAARAAGPGAGTKATLATLDEYFYGRALAESPAPDGGLEMTEATDCLRRALAAEPSNPIVLHALVLALVRNADPSDDAEAALLWHKHGLPHDLDLLGAAALALERRIRPLPAIEPEPDDGQPKIPWPTGLPEPEPEPVADAASDPALEPPSEILARDILAHAAATKSMGAPRRKVPAKLLRQMEQALMDHEPWKALRQATATLESGGEAADLQLIAGMAAEELGLERRARAHLTRAIQLDPKMLLARTALARVYWRLGWLDLALALWRSLPIEGPYDYGRHYHLALGHDALGSPAAAREAMNRALGSFFFDTRHFYIERAFWQWAQQVAQPVSTVD